MWPWILLYLSNGILFVVIEWCLIYTGRKRLFECEELHLKIAELCAFLFEALIWPFQLVRFIHATIVVLPKVTTEEHSRPG